MLKQKIRFLGPCWVFLRSVWVEEAKKKSKIFLDLARKKLCHVVEHIFVSNFVMYCKIPSHHLGADIWVWSFFFKRLFFHFFLGLCGPTGPIFTTAGGGLGVFIVATTLGYHLEVILLIWDVCSRSYGPGSDWGRIKVGNFFEPMTSGNSLFCRYCEWEQKTDSYYSLILRILGCGGRQSWKFEQKNFAKPKFEETDLYKKVFRKSFKRWIRRRRRRGQSLSCLTWPVRFRPVHFLCVAFDPFFFSFDLKNNVIQISTEPTYGTVLVAELAERLHSTPEDLGSNTTDIFVANCIENTTRIKRGPFLCLGKYNRKHLL